MYRAWDGEENRFLTQEELATHTLADVMNRKNDRYNYQTTVGTNDINRKPVFPGDIVRVIPKPEYRHLTSKTDIGIVEYVHSSYMIRMNDEEANAYFMLYMDIEVIGNVFENENILEKDFFTKNTDEVYAIYIRGHFPRYYQRFTNCLVNSRTLAEKLCKSLNTPSHTLYTNSSAHSEKVEDLSEFADFKIYDDYNEILKDEKNFSF